MLSGNTREKSDEHIEKKKSKKKEEFDVSMTGG
jgi:hypothetical protein